MDPDDAETAVEVVAEAADDVDTADGAEFVAGAVDVATIDPDELAAIQAENAALKRQLAAQQTDEKPAPAPGKERWWRKAIATILAIVAIVATVLSISTVWAKTTLQDEDQFVATLEPLPKEEVVADVVAVRVANGIVEAAGVEVAVAEALPPELALLSVPVTDSITKVISATGREFIQTDAFESIWSATLRVTHRAASAVISGNDSALVAEGGRVAIDLDAIGNAVAGRAADAGIELPDTELDLGEIVIYEDEQLAAVQNLAQAIDTAGWFVPLLALVSIFLAIAVSGNRRRMAAVLGFGTALGLFLSLLGLRAGRNIVVNAIEEEASQLAAGATWDLILNRLHQLTWAMLILALIVGIAAWVAGPSARSVQTREWASQTIGSWRTSTERHPNSFTGFIAEWRPTIEIVAVAVGLMYILFGPSPTGFSVLLTAVIVLAVIVAVEVLAVPNTEPADGPAAPDPEAVAVVDIDAVVEVSSDT